MSAPIGITQKYDLRDTDFSMDQENPAILTVTKKKPNGQETQLIVDFDQLSVTNKVAVLQLRMQNCWEEQQENIKMTEENIKMTQQIKKLDQEMQKQIDEVTAMVQDCQRMTGRKVMEPLPRIYPVKQNIESFEKQHEVHEQSYRNIAFVNPSEGKSHLPKTSKHRAEKKAPVKNQDPKTCWEMLLEDVSAKKKEVEEKVDQAVSKAYKETRGFFLEFLGQPRH